MITLAAIYAVANLSLIFFTLQTTLADPSDPTVTLERAYKQQIKSPRSQQGRLKFNPRDYPFFCDICRTHVKKGTKHCRACNRCAEEFDHHCNWVNNDIGAANFFAFCMMLTSLMVVLVAQIVMEVLTIVIRKQLELKRWIVVALWLCAAIQGVMLLQSAYLLGFTVYLHSQGSTTFEYIRKKADLPVTSTKIRRVNSDLENGPRAEMGACFGRR